MAAAAAQAADDGAFAAAPVRRSTATAVIAAVAAADLLPGRTGSSLGRALPTPTPLFRRDEGGIVWAAW